MKNYKHVVAALDLTEEAEAVLAKARYIADENDAELSLVTVIKPINYAYAGLDTASITSVSANFEQEARDFAHKRLTQIADSLSVEYDAIHACYGLPSQTIKDKTAEIGADLIVIGSHSRRGLGRLLGSTANAVLHGAECDVLAVRLSQQK